MNMNISWKHICDPFSVEGFKIKNWQKAVAIGVGLSLAPFLIIPGFLAFYAISGYFKSRLVKQLSHSTDDIKGVGRKILMPTVMANKSKSKGVATFSKIDATYPDFSQERCCDFAFNDPKSRFIAVFDAAGHNDKFVHDEQVPSFEEFCKTTAMNLSHQKFKTLAQAEEFLRKEFVQLSETFAQIQEEHLTGIHAGKKYAGPALMCGFPVSIGRQTHFVYAQVADCSLCYKSGGEVRFIAEADDVGLADPDFSGRRRLPTIGSFAIKKHAEIYLFSDGIGEFLTKDEFIQIIKSHSPENVLGACKTAIIEKQFDASAERIRIAQRPGMKSPSLCKEHDPKNVGLHDDLSLAYLRIG